MAIFFFFFLKYFMVAWFGLFVQFKKLIHLLKMDYSICLKRKEWDRKEGLIKKRQPSMMLSSEWGVQTAKGWLLLPTTHKMVYK